MEDLANRHRDGAPGDEALRHLRATQVEVAVLEAQVFGGLDPVLDRERRRVRAVQDREGSRAHLDPSGREVRVHGVGAAGHDGPRDVDDELAPELLGEGEDCGVGQELGVEDHLREARAVAEVDEYELAVVAAAVDPALQADRLACVGRAQGPCGRARESGHGRDLTDGPAASPRPSRAAAPPENASRGS